MEVEIYDKLDRGNLKLHATGGTRVGKAGGRLAIGGDRVPRGARGVPADMRPRNLKNAVVKGDAIYQRVKGN
ncbi:hypothetical protein, partial [Bifidobacterium pullorum]|uniref:hypothetical protein n=1 Tax=Bifidobacterium pullorum TaxID=78448 RepID=UPI00195D4475